MRGLLNKIASSGFIVVFAGCIVSMQARADDGAAGLVAQANALLDHALGGDDSVAQAMAKLQQALRLDPNNAAAYVALSRAKVDDAYIGDEQYDAAGLVAANAAVTRAIAIAPDSADGYLQQAVVLRLENQLPQAAAAVEAARKHGASGPLLELREAQLLGALGNSSAAQVKYQHIEHDPAATLPVRLSALENLTALYRKQHKIPQADAAMRKMVELSPGDAWTMGNYGTFLRIWMLRVDESEQWLRRARAVTDYPVARENLGFTLYLQWAAALHRNDTKRAQDYFDEATTLVRDPRELLREVRLYPHAHPIVEALQAKGYSIDRYTGASDDSDTPLSDAAKAGNASIVRQLITAGADVNRAGSGGGNAPLLNAVHGGNATVVRMLLTHGADPGRRTLRAMTARRSRANPGAPI
jgi:Tfp pilus assembly protein PilF